MKIKQCDCSTNAVLFVPEQETTTMVCLRCKKPYNLKPTDGITMTMPFKRNSDGTCTAEIVWNKY